MRAEDQFVIYSYILSAIGWRSGRPTILQISELLQHHHQLDKIGYQRSKMAWMGQLSKNLKELRVLFCQTSPASSSTRAFVEKNYKELKKANPKLPILIRECSGTEPQLWARYDMGVERGIRLEGMTETQISKALEDLAKVGASLKS
ncbi:hypothetical protein L1987_29561 [Smallanthus sonchifolius]|uniref:Uncharacterized protein n=2 Tax=Smallanthus sonchifolius TaxID=185202 RepID=A0ACB9I135_9ASTR|nr:hypothetical protein L1987_29561 [Smallanthus sonchifolius]